MSAANHEEQDEEFYVDVVLANEDLLSKHFRIVMAGVIGVIHMMILTADTSW